MFLLNPQSFRPQLVKVYFPPGFSPAYKVFAKQ